MKGLRRDLCLPLVALWAIVGMLSVTGEVSACSTKAASRAGRACCAASAGSACCCESTTVESQPESVAGTTVLPDASGLFAPKTPCQCRRGEPTEPASKPGQPSSQRRTDQGRNGSVGLTFEVRPAVVFVRLIPPTESPPGEPLYLRTSRLLI
jgi:hypothetical protein